MIECVGLIFVVGCVVAWRYMFPKPRTIPDMKRHLLFEVIEQVKATKKRQEKIDILHTNMCPGLAGILRMNFDHTLELDINLDLQYRERRERDFLDTLNHSSQMWRSFTKQSSIPQSRKNIRLRAMLESLEPREARLFLDAAKQNIRLGISKATLKRCFPQIFKSMN